jgi:hypothetical protein
MALTERYVEVIPAWVNATAYTTTPLSLVIGSDGNAYYCIQAHTSDTANDKPITGTNQATYWTICDGTATKPWTLTQAFASVAAGDRVNIKKGTYQRSATDTPTIDGTAETPVVFRGYNTSIGDLVTVGRTNGNGPLITTDFPTIAYDSTFRLNAGGADYVLWQNLKITATVSSYTVYTGPQCCIFQCLIVNASTNAAAIGLNVYGSFGYIVDSDIDMTGGSGTDAAISMVGQRLIGCHILHAPNDGIKVTSTAAVIIDCVIDNPGANGITFTSTTVTHLAPLVYGCTIYSAGGDGILLPNAANTLPFLCINSHITDSADYAIDSAYAGSMMGIFANNRTRDNAGGTIRGLADWAAATTFAHVTDDTGDNTTDFVNAGVGDFRLIHAASGKATGMPPYRDIGALQRAEPTFALAGDVDSLAAAYGDTVSQTTPTCLLPLEADVELDVQYGAGGTEFTGTLAGSGGGLPILGGSVVR